ncbi:MAG: flagellar hook-basal body complex protein, partial [Rickettsiaceae bacterium]|nr:flagellar hook-basal body complex protein [Rickettsiaceae bacterium]
AGFNITGSSLGVHDITSATLNPATTANPVPGEIGRSTLYITAPSSGVIKGDYVKIEGFGGLVVDGLYAVSDWNDNGFFVSLAVVPGAIPALGAPFAQPMNGSTWQKVPGQQFFETGAATLAAAGGGANDITVTIPSGAAGYAAGLPNENWADGDVVYISGAGVVLEGGRDVTLPDGYYIIAGLNLNAGPAQSTFTVTSANNVAAAGAPAAGNFSVRKVGTTGGAFGGGAGAATGTFDVPVMTTEDVGTGKIKYYVGHNHDYTVGDIISLTEGHAIDGINFAANTNYKITDAPNGENFVKFEVVGGVAGNGDGTDILTYNNGPLAGLRTNNFSRLFEFFGINQETEVYDATYAADNVDKNLTSGKFASSETFSHPLTVYDSLGSSYTLLLNFAKLATNKWAVEVAAQQDKDGIFDIQGLLTDNGVLRAGIIDFDTDGNVITPVQGFDAPLQVQRNNGSALSDITIDWENTLSDIQSGTVTQNKNPNNVEIVQGNGQPAGTLVNLAISPEGFVVGTFDSGESRNLYQIPLALFANVNGLIAGSNGVFEISRESGELLLKAAGVGGAGNTLGGVLEASNTDSTTELLSVQELSNTIRANARVAATEFKNIQTILSELNN